MLFVLAGIHSLSAEEDQGRHRLGPASRLPVTYQSWVWHSDRALRYSQYVQSPGDVPLSVLTPGVFLLRRAAASSPHTHETGHIVSSPLPSLQRAITQASPSCADPFHSV